MDRIIIETKKTNLNPNNSQGIKKNNMIFTSQKAAIDPVEGNVMAPWDIKAQTEHVIKNIVAIVEAGGGTRKDIVQINVYLQHVSYAQEMNEVYRKSFPPDELPARSVTIMDFTGDGGILVEMSAIASVG